MILGDTAWAELLSLANVGLGLFYAYLSIQNARESRGFDRTLQYILGAIGLYFAGWYAFVFIVPAGMYNPVTIPRAYFRPAFTIFLGVLSAGALYRWRLRRNQ